MKVIITDYYYPNINDEIEILSKIPNINIIDCKKEIKNWKNTEEEIIEISKDADAIIVQFAKITKNIIENLNKCKIIARYAIGVDTIDVKAANKKGIIVSNVPDYCLEEVSDTAIGHILNCIRKISFSRDLLLQNKFDFSLIKPMKKMSDLVIGILGFGNIGRAVARKLKEFNVQLLVYDPYFKEQEKYKSIKFVTFDDIIKESDVITIHLPLNKETKHMLSSEQFNNMKDEVIIINTSRGEIINEKDLLSALNNKKVSCCGLDVLQTENFYENILTHHPRVIVTPHIGWNSVSSIKELQRKTALNVYNMLINGEPLYKV